jgi:iron complex transport system ATP-binding protein
VPQGEEDVFPMTVREMVAMGRYPHLGAWRREGQADRAAIARRWNAATSRRSPGAVRRSPAASASARGSPARWRRSRRALRARRADAALDVRHEMAIFELLRSLGRAGATILVVTHNLNLAARYADRLLLLDAGASPRSAAPPRC